LVLACGPAGDPPKRAKGVVEMEKVQEPTPPERGEPDLAALKAELVM